jgi:hypothetical protein
MGTKFVVSIEDLSCNKKRVPQIFIKLDQCISNTSDIFTFTFGDSSRVLNICLRACDFYPGLTVIN